MRFGDLALVRAEKNHHNVPNVTFLVIWVKIVLVFEYFRTYQVCQYFVVAILLFGVAEGGALAARGGAAEGTAAGGTGDESDSAEAAEENGVG